MPKRLQTVVRECREVLEKEVLTQTSGPRLARVGEAELDAYVCDTALALLIEVALRRCVEVREGATTSAFSAESDWATLRGAISRERRALQIRIPFPLQWADLSALTISKAAFATLSHHLLESIVADDWRTDHILGWIYESFQADSAEQKHYGRFYTPEAVTRTIVEQAFELTPWSPRLGREGEPILPPPFGRGIGGEGSLFPLSSQERGAEGEFCPTILDLGCGCGAFALQAFERLFQQSQAAQRKTDHLTAHILAHHLFLIDSDPWACRIAALSLYLKAQRLDPAGRIERLNIVCADGLQHWEDAEHAADDGARNLFTKRYDLVIGNPPYSVVNQLRAPQELLRLYKSYRTAAYKINTFPLFVERGIDLLKPQGVLGMVVPNTLLTQMYFEPLRRYILDTCKIMRILDTKRVFATAFVENCILLLQREKYASGRSLHQAECAAASRSGNGIDSASDGLHRIGQRHFERAPFLMFQVYRDDGLRGLLEQIARDAPTLGDICESHDGVNPGNAKGKLIVSDKLDASCHKVLNGKNIQRYRLQWDGLYVRYDRALLSKGDNVRWGHREALDSAKILTRQTADRIIGTFDDGGGYYVTNSVHTTIMRPEFSAVSLKYVLALLNSKLIAWYYRKLFPEVGQVFSQVKLVNLRQLPVRLISPDGQQEIVALAEQLLEEAACPACSTVLEDPGVAIAPQCADPRKRRAGRIRKLDDHLDKLVYAAYQLAPDHIGLVEREFGG